MKVTKFNTNLTELVQYINDGADEAFSAVSLNPTYTWAKFILTDDQPNANKQRIPQEEFANLIKTGVFAPFKMKIGEIDPGHDESKPLGVITHLKQVGNKIEGLAALWLREREEDIALLKEMYAKGSLPQLSWEVMYGASEMEDDVEVLRDTALRATTVVGIPAYEGRTAVVALASKENVTEDLHVTDLEQLQKELEDVKAALASKETEFASLQEELVALREFKSGIEKEKADTEKLSSIKTKFESAGIKKDEIFYTEKRETLLALDDNSLDFMLQEMVSALASKETVASNTKGVVIPNLVDDEPVTSELDPVEIGKLLLASRQKK